MLLTLWDYPCCVFCFAASRMYYPFVPIIQMQILSCGKLIRCKSLVGTVWLTMVLTA